MFYDGIEQVHFEITSRCNAVCPMCPRFARDPDLPTNTLTENLTLGEITIDQFKVMFKPEFIKKLKRFRYCGNFGDPIVARDMLETVKYLREHSDTVEIWVHTNGGARTPEWWTELGLAIGDHGCVVFGIDGLEDTNHLYRQNVKWDKLMENVQACVDTGVICDWQMIVFRHNEHQIDDVVQLSSMMNMGVKVRSTARFRRGDNMPVRSRSGDITHHLQIPSDEFKNASVDEYNELIRQKRLDGELDRTPISCHAQNIKEIYVAYDGMVFPCCWIATWWLLHRFDPTNPYQMLIEENGGTDTVNALYYDIEEIANGPMFGGVIDSWDKPSLKEGRMWSCTTYCGTETKFRSANIIAKEYFNNIPE